MITTSGLRRNRIDDGTHDTDMLLMAVLGIGSLLGAAFFAWRSWYHATQLCRQRPHEGEETEPRAANEEPLEMDEDVMAVPTRSKKVKQSKKKKHQKKGWLQADQGEGEYL